MDKNAIKKYAVWARRELISRVSQRAAYYGIAEGWDGDATAEIVMGRVLSAEEKTQRQALGTQIRQKGYQQVMEEVAYTWFNRFIALRFMEVNGYLPSHVRVFTDEGNQFKPQILAEAIHMELDGLDMQKVYAFKNANDDDGLFKYMIIVQCNALSSILPGMFQQISDYTELLFPDNLLREGSVLQQMIELIPEEDWKDAVQIIGWLYQYYNAEKKDEVFAALKKNVKITKENIPAATQLFTPDWIVRYMVENSLGRLWVEGHPNDELKATWKYYLEEAEQEPDVQVQLAEIRKEYAAMTPEQIKCIDPCCGSGHILAYLFDVLMQIYESYGYTPREAVASIVQNNLYGLDIDDRAAQLAYFAVMMKARQYDRRFFSRDIQPHVYAIQNSEPLSNEAWEFLGEEEEIARRLWESFVDAKEYGSLVQPNVTLEELERLKNRVTEVDRMGSYGNLFADAMSYEVLRTFEPLIELAQALVQKYDVVVTNPPYMGSSGMGAKLADFVKKNYPDSKSDMSTVCMEKTMYMCKTNGYVTMINIPVWMFLSSYEKLRENLLSKDTLVNMVHPGRGIFGSDFGTVAFVFRKSIPGEYRGTYCRLFALQGEVKPNDERENAFLAGKGHFVARQSNFSKIPGSPVAYWVSGKFTRLFNGEKISDYAEPRHGMSTGNNELCLKLWHEVQYSMICFGAATTDEFDESGCRYAPYKKGGEYRLWYGNNDYVIAYSPEARRIMESLSGYRASSNSFFFLPSINWSDVSASYFGVRLSPKGFAFDGRGASMFCQDNIRLYLLGLLASKVTSYTLNVLNPTLTFNINNIAAIPVILEDQSKVESISRSCVSISRNDWDAFEFSWDFKRHPLI